ncbi:MAG: response regulator [Patescibacteria group bacterium]
MKKILIIEDDRDVAQALTTVLKDTYQIQVLYQGGSVRKTIREFKADLVLLDLLIPGESGIDICKRVKNEEDLKHIPIIIVSAHPGARDIANEIKADDFLAKPFDMKKMFKIIEKHLQKVSE